MPQELQEFSVCPFTIIIDTREQAPFSFREMVSLKRHGGKPLIVKTERKGLSTGDYSILGAESKVAIERKEMGDFFHCCGSDRERFENQLRRLNEMEFGWIMIEASWTMIMRGHRESEMNPQSILGSVISWQMEHFPKVHWWFCDGKRFAEIATFRILDRWWRMNEV